MLSINGERFLGHLHALGRIGVDAEGRRTRQAATDEDRLGRETVIGWMKEAGLRVELDRVGNIYGFWETEENAGRAPFAMGSHIDTVIDAGQYDGCAGVLSGLEVIQTMKEAGLRPARPLALVVFTNEEGTRFHPDMVGSLTIAGGISVEDALASPGTDGTTLGAELARIHALGDREPTDFRPAYFIELHIEQGPVLDAEQTPIGAVTSIQGISWHEITIDGAANHAGTTPTSMRRDAGLAAAKVLVFLRERCTRPGSRTVATAGRMAFSPNAVNVIPGRAVFTVDMRCPDEQELQENEQALYDFLASLEQSDHVSATARRMVRFQPVVFDGTIVQTVLDAAAARDLKARPIASGAGQDAQMISRVCPTAMIFVPSVGGVSHSPKEFTADGDLVNGANVLLDAACRLANA